MVDEQIVSLGNVFKEIDKPISMIYLSNNQMKGPQFATLLQCLSAKPIKSIIYGNKNEFNKECFDKIKDIYLSRAEPYNLEELKLIDVKIRDKGVLFDMLNHMKNDFFLKSLCLSKVNLDKINVNSLCNILELQPPSLRELDISWSKIDSLAMEKIFRALKGNNQIRKLNLAFNPVSKSDNLKDFGNFLRQNTSL
jgi:Leucine-rich repeat (LRR) protein